MGKSRWRRAFDAVEGVAGPGAEQLVRTPAFALTLELVQKTTAKVGTAAERRTRRLWHTINLPAGTDVRKLRRQVGDLDHEVRLLRAVVERADRQQVRASATSPKKGSPRGSRSAPTTQPGPGTHPAGPGAQRAPRPKRDQGGQRSG
jgi:hypothetical protein